MGEAEISVTDTLLTSEENQLTNDDIVLEPTNISENANKKEGSPSVPKPVKFIRLPFSKIKQIMKMDPDCVIVQQDAVFLVTKATEMFIEFLTKESNKQLAGNKRKTMLKRDVEATIETIPQLCFLDGALE